MTSSDDGPGGNFVEACCSAQALTVFNSVEGVGGGGGGRGGGSAGGRGGGVGGGRGDICGGGDEVDSSMGGIGIKC